MTTRVAALLAGAIALGVAIPPAGAQTIAERVAALRDGTLQLRYASRPGACGDGAGNLRVGLGGGDRYDVWPGRPCEPGPVRLVATVRDGRVARLRAYVGPDRGARADTDLGRVSTAEAAGFLSALIEGPDADAARGATEALVLADSTDPWPTLLRAARSASTPRRAARSAAFWLGQGAAATLGVDGGERSTDDEMRAQAVFALSQQPRDTSVPELLEIARHSRHSVARAQALFWLGQGGDPRALDLFAEILRIR